MGEHSSKSDRSPTPVLTEFERNKIPLMHNFPHGMYINTHNELQKIETTRQVSANFAKDLLEDFSCIKVEPYDDLHERNCFNRDWRNRKKRKMSQEETTEHQECTCICREKNELLGRYSRFVVTRMLSQTANSRKQLPLRNPLYSQITVPDAELLQCVSVEQYKLVTLDQAEFSQI